MESYCGTPITMAPEILKQEPYNEKCDIWSIGVIIYQMLYGQPPFKPKKGASCSDLLNLIEKGMIDFKTNEEISEKAIDLIKKMLVYNPNKRISFENFFEHP